MENLYKSLRSKIFKVMLLAFAVVMVGSAYGQNYRSAGTGNWSSAGTWEVENGGVWEAATSAPGGATEEVIVIQSGHTVTIASDVSLDGELDVEGILIISSGGWQSTGGSLEVYGTVRNSGSFDSNGNVAFMTGSHYYHEFQNSAGEIPLASIWDLTSTIHITEYQDANGFGSTEPIPGLNQEFGNLVWDTPLMTKSQNFGLFGALNHIKGNLTFSNTGAVTIYLNVYVEGAVGEISDYALNIDGDLIIDTNSKVVFGYGGSSTINVGGNLISKGEVSLIEQGSAAVDVTGDFIMASGAFDFLISGSAGNTATLSVTGDFSSTGGVMESHIGAIAGISTIKFFGLGERVINVTNLIPDKLNFIVETGVVANIPNGSFLSGTGSFTTNAGVTLKLGSTHTAGSFDNTNGNIRTTSASIAAGTTIELNGTGDQYLGSNFPSDVNLIINNSSSTGTVFVNRNLTISSGRTLDLVSGVIDIGDNYELSIEGTLASSGGEIGVSEFSSLTLNNAGSLTSIPFSSASNKIKDLRYFGANTLSVKGIEVVGELELGGGVLDFSGSQLTLSGTLTSGGGTIQTNSASNLYIGGTGNLGGVVPFAPNSEIGAIIMDRASSGAASVGAVKVLGALQLKRGTLTLPSSGFQLNGGATVVRTVGTLSETGTLNALGLYDVVYLAGVTTGSELVADDSKIKDIIVSANTTATITLGASRTINGNLFLNTEYSIFAIGANTLTLKGGLVTTGTLQGGPTSNIAFAGAGPYEMPNIQGGINNLSVDSPGGVTLTSDITVPGILYLGAGDLTIGANTLTINGTLDNSGGGTLIGGPGANLAYGNHSEATILPSVTGGLDNLTIDRSGSVYVDMTGPTEVRKVLTLNSGILNSDDGADGYLTVDLNTGYISGEGTGSLVGNVNVKKTISGKGFHYTSMPLQGATFDMLEGVEINSKYYINVYDESGKSELGKDSRWDYVEPTAELESARGYNVYYNAENQDVSLSHTYDHSGTYSYTTTYSGDPADAGWNLIGNPYPSPVDFDKLGLSNVNQVAYIKTSAGVYNSYTIGAGGVNDFNGDIPSFQSFFVRATANGGYVSFDNLARDTESNPAVMRKAEKTNILSLTVSKDGKSDEVLVGFFDDATYSHDSFYDATFLPSGENVLRAYTESEGEKYSINALPLEDAYITVPYNIAASSTGTFTITAEEVGAFYDYDAVYLEDKLTGAFQNLLTDPVYEVDLEKGEVADRFNITFSKAMVTPVTDAQIGSSVSVSSYNNSLTVNFTNMKGPADIIVYNTLGQEILNTNDVNTSTGSFTHAVNVDQAGIYIVKIASGNETFTEKVFIKK